MKKIIIIDGGPRRNMNTARLLHKFAEGANYDRYELGGFSEEAKHAWRDAHWEEDLQKAFETGKKMAEQ